MMIKFFTSLSIAIVLSVCVPTAGVCQDSLETLRTLSLDQVGKYASETRLFFEKNGQRKTIAAAQESIDITLSLSHYSELPRYTGSSPSIFQSN
jgi:hypothetical protein